MATVLEPKRRGLLATAGAKPKSLPVGEILRFLAGEWKTYVPIFVTLAFRAMLGFGIIVWLPSFFIRTYGWTAAQIGYAQGFILLLVAPVALVCGGWFAAWLARRGYEDANLRVVMIASLAIAPCALVFPQLSDGHAALALYALYTFLAYLSPGPQNAALQIITPNQMRAQITAIFILIFNLVGVGIGPTLVAVFTDYVLGAPELLRHSLSIAGITLAPLAALVTWLGLKSYTESLRRAEMRT
jgi:MFS family permease